MSKATDVFLNTVFLKNRIAELGIKQWWLAEQVGVDRKTVTRWLQGQVKSINLENVKSLADILDCKLTDLTLSNQADQFATSEDQKTAATLLIQSSLIEKLGPLGEWNVIESLLKASLIPYLPISVLGEFYNQLTIASWRQGKLEQAQSYNQKAEDLAHRSGDKDILANALLSKANFYSWSGKTGQAIQTYRECLNLEPFIDPKAFASTLSNLGSILYEAGDLVEAEKLQKRAIETFAFDGKAMNLSIAWCGLAMIFLEREDLAVANTAIDKSEKFAVRDDYRRGISMGKLLRAEFLARQGLAQDASQLLREGLDGFLKLKIDEGLNYEYAGRTCRMLGDLASSERYLRQGLAICTEFPIYRAGLLFELAKTLQEKATGSPEVIENATLARGLYQQCEANFRVKLVNKFMTSVA